MTAQQTPVDGKADSSGNALVTLPSFAMGITRTITQVAIQNGSTPTNIDQLAQLQVNGLLDCATRCNPDTASGALDLRSSDKLTVKWTGLDADVTVQAVFTYDDKQV